MGNKSEYFPENDKISILEVDLWKNTFLILKKRILYSYIFVLILFNESGEKRMRTIIIEDNNLMLEATKIIIEKNDYLNIVEAFNDGNKALERLEELHPKVVFLDV